MGFLWNHWKVHCSVFSVSQWMVHQLGSSRTWNRREFRIRRTRRWEYTRVCGMQMTGPQEVVWWRQIGAKRHSLPLTEISEPMHVFGRLELRLVVRIHGCLKSWIQQEKRSWNGCRRTTWSTITAQIRRGSHKAFLKNARLPKDNRTSLNVCSSDILIKLLFFL